MGRTSPALLVPPSPSGPSARSVWICAWLVALLLAFFLVGLRVEMNIVYAKASIERMMAHSAPTPYQYRVLVPEILRWLYDAGVLSRNVIAPQEAAMVVDVLALLVCYGCVRSMLRLAGAGERTSSIVALSFFFLLPFQYLLARIAPYWYVWDAPAVMFFSLGLVLMRLRKWSSYYVLFAIATLNKESSIFLTVVHVFTGWGETPAKKLAAHIAAQAGIWFAIKFGLARAFVNDSLLGLHLEGIDWNFMALRTPASLLQIASCFGFLWIPVVLFRKHIEDRFLRRAVLVIGPFFAVGFVSGELTEVRIFCELTPLIVLALYAVFARSRELNGRPGTVMDKP